MVLALLTQPRLLWHWFTPVSFWLLLRDDDVLAVIAEVNNTFGQRHSYLCHNPGFAPITREPITAAKVFHVSPFQDVSGGYSFSFDITASRICIGIRLLDHAEGLEAVMTGPIES